MFQQEKIEEAEAVEKKIEAIRENWEELTREEKFLRIRQAESHLLENGLRPTLEKVGDLLGVSISTVNKYKKLAA